MLGIWFDSMKDVFPALGMFGDITFRCMLAALTAFAVTVAAGSRMIRAFRRSGVIEDTSQPDHAGLNAIQSKKKNVPTMGGLLILAGVVVALILWSDLRIVHVHLGLFCLLALGALGLADDVVKLRRGRARGLRKRTKLAVQFTLGALVGGLLLHVTREQVYATRFYLPFSGGRFFNLGPWYVLWVAFVITASSNAVNLADGLDGLAGGCAAMTAAALLGLGCFVARPELSGMLSLPCVQDAPELCLLSAAILGAMLGFLWYNCHPAQIFMGDTGSLALGGGIGFIALALKLDLLLFLVGIVFFVDLLTVAMQIAGFKLTRRRIFPITPIHHYFQTVLRWPEQKITVRLWIIAALAAVMTIATLRFG